LAMGGETAPRAEANFRGVCLGLWGMGEIEDAITLKSVTIEPNECPLGSELRIKIEFKYVRCRALLPN